jgi:hypothetical protein
VSETATNAAPNDIGELVPEFKVMLQAANRSPATIAAYMAGVEALRSFLVEQGMPTAVDAVAREHVEAFYAWMLEAGYAPASVKNRHDGIRQFFAWCEEEGEISDGKSPMRHVKAPIVPMNPPNVLTEDQIRALLEACDGRSSRIAGTRPSSGCCMTPVSRWPSARVCRSPTSISPIVRRSTFSGRAGRSESSRSGPTPPDRLGDTAGCVGGIATTDSRRCGSASGDQ